MHSIFIIDDHDIVRFGLSTLLGTCAGVRVAGVASSLHDGLNGIALCQPDLVVSDLSMPDSHGLDTVRAVVAAQAGRGVLIISMHDELMYAEQALALGASGYLMKEKAQEQALEAVLSVLGGKLWVSPAVHAQMLGRLHLHPHVPGSVAGGAPHAKLSARELEVIELLGAGKTTKGIAFALGLSARTVDIHRANLKKKLGLKSGAELISWAASRL